MVVLLTGGDARPGKTLAVNEAERISSEITMGMTEPLCNQPEKAAARVTRMAIEERFIRISPGVPESPENSFVSVMTHRCRCIV